MYAFIPKENSPQVMIGRQICYAEFCFKRLSVLYVKRLNRNESSTYYVGDYSNRKEGTDRGRIYPI